MAQTKKTKLLVISIILSAVLVNAVLYYSSSVRYDDAREYLLSMDLSSLDDNILLNSQTIYLGMLLNTAILSVVCWFIFSRGSKSSTDSIDVVNTQLQNIIDTGRYKPIKDMTVDFTVANLCEKINIIIDNIQDNTLKSKIITDKIAIGLTFLDKDGATKWINPVGKMMLGFDVGRDCGVQCDEYWQSCQHFPLKEAIDSGDSVQSDVYCNLTDRWFQVNISPFYNLDNELSGFVLSFHDITDRYRAQQGLSNIGKIISSSDLLAVVRDVHEDDFLPVSYISSNVMNVLEYSANIILSGSVSFDSLIHPDDLQLVNDENKGYMYHTNQEKWVHNPYRLVKKDGTVIWIEECTTCVRDGDGKPLVLRSVIKDVTEEVHARQHRRQAWSIARMGYWSYDGKNKQYKLSAEAAEILGVTECVESMTFDNMMANVISEDKEKLDQVIEESVTDKNEVIKVDFCAKVNGQVRHIMFNSSNEYSQDGEIIGKYGIVQDISLMKGMETELESERIKYYSVYKYSGDAIVIFNSQHNILDCNNRTLELFKVNDIEELKNQHVSALGDTSNTDIGSVQEEITNIFNSVQEKNVSVFDWSCQDNTGKTFPAQVSLSKFTLNNNIYYQAVIRDISKEMQWRADMEKSRTLAVDALNDADQTIMDLQKQLNEMNNKAKEAEIANVIKSEFLTCMSHEIRTPLNAIIGFANVLKGSELTSDNRNFVEQICVSGKHLQGVINEVLDLSKIESGKMAVTVEKFALHDLLNHVEMIISQQVTEKGLSFVVNKKDNVSDVLETDMQHLKQCLINLVANAIKFTESGGITIDVSRASDNEGRECVEFAVTDTGIGISQDQLMSIFEPFVQSSQPEGQISLEGSGLGLSITKKLAGLMGGDVKAYSQKGKGSTFTLKIPVVHRNQDSLLADGTLC